MTFIKNHREEKKWTNRPHLITSKTIHQSYIKKKKVENREILERSKGPLVAFALHCTHKGDYRTRERERGIKAKK